MVRAFWRGWSRPTNHHTDAGGVVAAPAVVGAALGANRAQVSPNPPKAAPRHREFTSNHRCTSGHVRHLLQRVNPFLADKEESRKKEKAPGVLSIRERAKRRGAGGVIRSQLTPPQLSRGTRRDPAKEIFDTFSSRARANPHQIAKRKHEKCKSHLSR